MFLASGRLTQPGSQHAEQHVRLHPFICLSKLACPGLVACVIVPTRADRCGISPNNAWLWQVFITLLDVILSEQTDADSECEVTGNVVRAQVLDDTSSGQHCLVRDVTLRLLKGRHWSQNELVASDNGPEPIYDSCCDAAETGLSNTLYWELDTSAKAAGNDLPCPC